MTVSSGKLLLIVAIYLLEKAQGTFKHRLGAFHLLELIGKPHQEAHQIPFRTILSDNGRGQPF